MSEKEHITQNQVDTEIGETKTARQDILVPVKENEDLDIIIERILSEQNIDSDESSIKQIADEVFDAVKDKTGGSWGCIGAKVTLELGGDRKIKSVISVTPEYPKK